MSITGIESTVAQGTKASASQAKLADNFDTFLVMLTTQLKHQDPLSPMDSTEFTNQLVQFANVEQQIAANSNLEKLIGVNMMGQKATAISYIGHTIEAASSGLPLQGTVETEGNELKLLGGKAYFSYDLPKTASSVDLIVKDADGNTVRTMTGLKAAGTHDGVWDGTNADGETMPAGTYTIHVAATASDGSPIIASTKVRTQAGSAAFSYTLAEEARTVSLVIKDGSGKIVRTLTGQGDAGRHEASWDGKDKDGQIMPDGRYVIEVVAVDGENNPVEAATTVYGRVTDVSADETEVLLNMGGVVTTLEDVLTVRDTAAALSN